MNAADQEVGIYLSANGAMVYGPVCPDGFLPVLTGVTEEEASGLQVALCRLSRQDNETYFLPFPEGNMDALRDVTDMLQAFYGLQQQGVRGIALWEPVEAYKAKFGLL